MSAQALPSYGPSSSSPDPLNDSLDRVVPVRSSPIRQNYVAKSADYPKSNNDAIRFEDLLLTTPPRKQYASSPTKTKAQSENLLSPWRIRVTVEAEPEEENSGMEGFGTTTTRNVTTKVPLRGGDSSPSFQKEARGRSRKSDAGGASPKKGKRNGTPARKNRRRSVTNLDLTVLGDDSDDIASTPRRRRKSKPRESTGKVNKLADKWATEEMNVPNSAPSIQMKKTRRKDSGQFDIAVDSDTEDGKPSGAPYGAEPYEEGIDTGPLNTIDANVQISRGNKTSKTSKIFKDGWNDANGSQPSANSRTDISRRKSGSYPTPASSVGDENDQNNSIDDPTDEHQEYDSILESEGFSMISLDSISSAKQHLSSPLNTITESSEEPEHSHREAPREGNKQQTASAAEVSSPSKPLSAIPSYLGADDSEISSTMPSSPPMLATPPMQTLVAQHTPAVPQSSPKLPSLPRQPSPVIRANQASTGAPKLARVIRAGIALQGVLEPVTAGKSSLRSGIISTRRLAGPNIVEERSPRERIDDLFVGFDSSTRRELRAGLRLGEELAKRQREKEERQKMSSSPLAEKRIEQYDSVMDVDYPTLPKTTSPPKEKISSPFNDHSLVDRAMATPTRSDRDRTTSSSRISATVDRERQWQRERKAVSQQIDVASISKVIVVDSDGDEDESGGATAPTTRSPGPPESYEQDIWQLEAHDSSQNSSMLEYEHAAQPKVQAGAKPRRNKIPSPWKRGEAIDESTLPVEEPSGLFWQANDQPTRVFSKFGKIEPKAESTFDLSALLGTRDRLGDRTPIDLSPKKSSPQRLDSGIHVAADEDEQENKVTDETVISSFEESASVIPDQKVPVNFGDSSAGESRSEESSQVRANQEYGESEVESEDESKEVYETSEGEKEPQAQVAGEESIDMSIVSSTPDSQFALRSGPEIPATSPLPPSSWLGKLTGALWTSNPPSASSASKEAVSESRHAQSMTQTSSKSVVFTLNSERKSNISPKRVSFSPLPPSVRSISPMMSSSSPSTSPLPTLASKSASPTMPVPTFSNSHPSIEQEPTPEPHSQHSSSATKSSSSQPQPPSPLAPSGYFTNSHYRALHKLYHKSKYHPDPSYFLLSNSTFTLHSLSASPHLNQPMSYTSTDEEGETIVYIEPITLLWLVIVNRFISDVREGDLRAGGDGAVEWDEEDLLKRLFSIVVGERVRQRKTSRTTADGVGQRSQGGGKGTTSSNVFGKADGLDKVL